jgi:hypothetical protein
MCDSPGPRRCDVASEKETRVLSCFAHPLFAAGREWGLAGGWFSRAWRRSRWTDSPAQLGRHSRLYVFCVDRRFLPPADIKTLFRRQTKCLFVSLKRRDRMDDCFNAVVKQFNFTVRHPYWEIIGSPGRWAHESARNDVDANTRDG